MTNETIYVLVDLRIPGCLLRVDACIAEFGVSDMIFDMFLQILLDKRTRERNGKKVPCRRGACQSLHASPHL